MTSTMPTPAPAVELDGGDMDCGSGLLLAITTRIRSIEPEQVMMLRTRERSVLADLPAWARLAGHELIDAPALGDAGVGPWELLIRRGHPRGRPAPQPEAEYTSGAPARLGTRLWLYSNFHCNLACDYCCAASSPKAEARLFPVETAAAAAAEFAAQGGHELLITGGEPFLHPELGELVAVTAAHVPVTILTNAMVFSRGRRRDILESMDRESVTLQVSLDSAGPALHDRQRGAGSHAKALAGIELARELGFRVRVAATYPPQDAADAGDLVSVMRGFGIAEEDLLIRPVAHEGNAEDGVDIGIDTIEPEPTLTADGAWWHPVAVTNPHLKVADSPLPVQHVIDVMRDVVSVQEAAGAQGRTVFRCT